MVKAFPKFPVAAKVFLLEGAAPSVDVDATGRQVLMRAVAVEPVKLPPFAVPVALRDAAVPDVAMGDLCHRVYCGLPCCWWARRAPANRCWRSGSPDCCRP